MEKMLRRYMLVTMDKWLADDTTCRHDLQLTAIVGVNAVMASPKDGSAGCLVMWQSGNVWALPTLGPREAIKYVRSLLKGRTPCQGHPPLTRCRWVHEGVDALGWRTR